MERGTADRIAKALESIASNLEKLANPPSPAKDDLSIADRLNVCPVCSGDHGALPCPLLSPTAGGKPE